jgi:HicB family
MRTYAGKILIRVPRELHKELAREAFESGRSINQLCLEAILARRALKKYDPWKAVQEIWDENRGVDERQLQRDILKGMDEVRRGR